MQSVRLSSGCCRCSVAIVVLVLVAVVGAVVPGFAVCLGSAVAPAGAVSVAGVGWQIVVIPTLLIVLVRSALVGTRALASRLLLLPPLMVVGALFEGCLAGWRQFGQGQHEMLSCHCQQRLVCLCG